MHPVMKDGGLYKHVHYTPRHWVPFAFFVKSAFNIFICCKISWKESLHWLRSNFKHLVVKIDIEFVCLISTYCSIVSNYIL